MGCHYTCMGCDRQASRDWSWLCHVMSKLMKRELVTEEKESERERETGRGKWNCEEERKELKNIDAVIVCVRAGHVAPVGDCRHHHRHHRSVYK